MLYFVIFNIIEVIVFNMFIFICTLTIYIIRAYMSLHFNLYEILITLLAKSCLVACQTNNLRAIEFLEVVSD